VTVKVEIYGGRELERALDRIGRAAAGKALEDAALDALEPMLNAVEAKTPMGETGNLRRRNKKQIWKSSPKNVDAEVINSARHAHLVEYGHELVKGGRLGRGGRVVGSVPPHPFFRPAVDQTKSAVQNRAADNVRKIIERAV
jgi:HK97 gp10 family phage protein